MHLNDIDGLIASNAHIRNEAVEGTKALLAAARFDIAKWTGWLAAHGQRPINVA